jgi:hypothetical protein
MKRSMRRPMKQNPLGRVKEKLEKAKASVHAKGKHPLSCAEEPGEASQDALLRPNKEHRASAYPCFHFLIWYLLTELSEAFTLELRAAEMSIAASRKRLPWPARI